jgi:polysaccharide deacetylase family protein (PEP-CTERM system associated)
MKLILTFDVEEYFQVENFKPVIKRGDWHDFESRLHIGIDKIMAVLGQYDAKATFFFLGCVAEKHPDVVKRLSDAGHEIASHGYGHDLVYNLTEEKFREDVRRSLNILAEITNKKVLSYRAPCFSISKKTPWAYTVLASMGIEFDASLFPMHHDRYGLPSTKRFPYMITTAEGDMLEIPIATAELWGKRIPFAGGGYFRAMPFWTIKQCMHQVNKCDQPVVMYFHPWEFDPKQPRVKTNALASFRHYMNLNKTENKLRSIMNGNEFMTVAEFGTKEGALK